jgi:hypothetical protein
VRLEGLGQLKKSNDLIGNRTRHLLAYSIMPEPTMLPCVLSGRWGEEKILPLPGFKSRFSLYRLSYPDFCLNTDKETKQTNKLRGLSSQANYTDRATAAYRRR